MASDSGVIKDSVTTKGLIQQEILASKTLHQFAVLCTNKKEEENARQPKKLEKLSEELDVAQTLQCWQERAPKRKGISQLPINKSITNSSTEEKVSTIPTVSPVQSVYVVDVSNATDEKSKQKKKRRKRDEIERNFKCPVQCCAKSYGSEGALKTHIKLKHAVPSVGLTIGTARPEMYSPPSLANVNPNPPQLMIPPGSPPSSNPVKTNPGLVLPPIPSFQTNKMGVLNPNLTLPPLRFPEHHNNGINSNIHLPLIQFAK